MKQPIRYFAIGLLTATLISLFTFLFFYDPSSDATELSIDELITEIENEGYYVLTESEYISYAVQKDQLNENDENEEEEDGAEDNDNDVDENNEEENDPSDEDNDTEDNEDNAEETEEVITYTLVVEPNMLGPTVSELLAENNIIDDANAFNRYLEEEGYAPYIQIGEHELTSDMSFYEIAETIARSR